jgi:signal transduction histidine kinase
MHKIWRHPVSMRRQILTVTIGSTLLVILAFALPLGLLIGPLLKSHAEQVAVNQAQNVAIFLRNGNPTDVQVTNYIASQSLTDGLHVSVVTPSGVFLGVSNPGPLNPPIPEAPPPRGRPGGEAGPAEPPRLDRVPGGEVAQVVATSSSGTYLVTVFVADSRLSSGFGGWLTLLVGVSAFLALASALAGEVLSRRLVNPLEKVARVAQNLAAGEPVQAANVARGPSEVIVLARTMSRLAERIDSVVTNQRTRQADMSHLLRTPLAALRLEIEAVSDDPRLGEVRTQVAALEAAVAHLPRSYEPLNNAPLPTSDVEAVVTDRLEFWSVLADDEERHASVELSAGPLVVRADATELSAAVDALMENVFAHTEAGVTFSVTVESHESTVSVTVADAGFGLPATVLETRTADRVSRGTGLARATRCAVGSGGSLLLGKSPLGGAQVTLILGRA